MVCWFELVSRLGRGSIGLVLLKPSLRPNFIFNKKSSLFLGLDVGSLDLSFWSQAFGPDSVVTRNHYCFWTWMSEHWTCPFLHFQCEIMIVSELGCWSIGLACRSIGLVLLKLGLQPSFIFNKKSFLFLDLDVGALDLSFWNWAFGPASFLIRNQYCFWTWM